MMNKCQQQNLQYAAVCDILLLSTFLLHKYSAFWQRRRKRDEQLRVTKPNISAQYKDRSGIEISKLENTDAV